MPKTNLLKTTLPIFIAFLMLIGCSDVKNSNNAKDDKNTQNSTAAMSSDDEIPIEDPLDDGTPAFSYSSDPNDARSPDDQDIIYEIQPDMYISIEWVAVMNASECQENGVDADVVQYFISEIEELKDTDDHYRDLYEKLTALKERLTESEQMLTYEEAKTKLLERLPAIMDIDSVYIDSENVKTDKEIITITDSHGSHDETVYNFSFRYNENMPGSEDHLAGYYSISCDGERVYRYDLTEDSYVRVLPLTIMINGINYHSTYVDVPVEVDDSAIQYTTSYAEDGIPKKDGEANMALGTPYAVIEDGIVVVLIDSEWVRFAPELDQN